MTNDKASDRDVNRAIRSWLREDRHEDVSRVAGAVLDQVETIPQRRATWWPAWRTPTMNKLVTYGLGAAAVVVLLFAGSQLVRFLQRPDWHGADARPRSRRRRRRSSRLRRAAAACPWAVPTSCGTASRAQEATSESRSASPFRLLAGTATSGEGILKKNDNADAPNGAGVTVFARTNDLFVGAGDMYVYGDPCHWASTRPDTPVTTVDEAIAALSAQASRDASTPVDITLGRLRREVR